MNTKSILRKNIFYWTWRPGEGNAQPLHPGKQPGTSLQVFPQFKLELIIRYLYKYYTCGKTLHSRAFAIQLRQLAITKLTHK